MRLPIDEHLKKHPGDIRKATVICFVVSRASIIAVGYNRKRFKDGEGGAYSWHAEEAALHKAGRRAQGATLYVIRLLKDGNYAMAAPCDRCERLRLKRGIVKVKYSTEDWNRQ